MATITLGITGGIAAYKIPDLVRQFRKLGHSVHCIVTDSALRFVTSETLGVVSESPVLGPRGQGSSHIDHLDARRSSDCFIVAPATANFIAKAALGIADSVLLSSFLAYNGPKIVVPAMHDTMWTNPATQKNVAQLREWGIDVLGPDTGDLASGDVGPGRMVELSLITLKAHLSIHNTPRLDGIKIVVAMGGTRERIDPVRRITNLSSGKLGETLSHALALQGATVSVISTVPLSPNPHLSLCQSVETSDELRSTLQAV